MKALEKERISPYISQLYECGINDSDIKLVVDQFRADLSGSSSLFLLRDDDKSDGIKLFSSGLTEAQQQFYVQHHRQDVWFNHYLDKGCQDRQRQYHLQLGGAAGQLRCPVCGGRRLSGKGARSQHPVQLPRRRSG